ncbi:hypothetical protein C8R41DRAFT_920074 [Lentinula lateritia]|uniref:Uncharacterized protein n=1 Tax=Lentinula lateritia TaxID=40482 RepID=A0ABQ8VF77_9AGAR|nr:hypothetical protein C8R41DRAFT_920074 [Lentinula lateritia]
MILTLSDQEPEEQLELDADTSITGLVGEIFAGSHQTSTPPQHHLKELPPGLETEDGVPLGQTHHADRVMKYYQEHESHPFVEPTPHTIVHTPTFPIHATATSPPPATPASQSILFAFSRSFNSLRAFVICEDRRGTHRPRCENASRFPFTYETQQQNSPRWGQYGWACSQV